MQTALVFLLIVIFAVAALILLIDPNDYREQITAKASESLAQDLRINGEMSWSFWPSLALQLDEVELDNPNNFERRNMLSADEISVSLELAPLLSREFVIKRVDLRNADVTIVTRKDGISNLDHILTSSASAERSDEDGGIRSGPVRLENVSITLLDEATDSSQLLDIDLAQLDYYAANENLPFSIDADVSDGGNQVLTGVVATGEVVIPSDNTPITVSNLDLSAALSGLSDQFNLEGNVSIDTRNGLLVEMKNGTAQLDGETFSLAASLRSGDISSIGFDISGDSLDLDRLLGTDTGAETPTTSVEEDLEWLKTTDLNGNINIESVRFNNMDLADVSARITSKAGRLTVAPFSATAFGGRIEGSLEVDLNQSPVQVRFSPVLSDMDIGALSEHLTGTRLVESQGDLALDLSGAGLEPSSLLGTLSGGGEYALSAGELLGIDLNALIDDLLTAPSLQAFDQAFAGSTSFSQMAGELTARDGVLETPGLMMQSDNFDVSGEGAVDLATETLDYSLNLQLKGELKDRLAAKSSMLKSGLIPLRIHGSLVEPSVGFDASAMVTSQVSSKVDEAKDEVK
jgi:AsmA protein